MIKADLVPQIMTVYLNKGEVFVDCSFMIGSHKISNHNNVKIGADMTDKLLKVIQEEVFPQLEAKFNEKLERDGEE
jgi:hypothetical protein